jgi:hypothetical protein
MSLEHHDDRRKGMSRRAKEMAKAVRVLGPEVRNISTYDADPDKRVELAKLLSANAQQPGVFGYFLAALTVEDGEGHKQRVVREGSIKDTLIKLSIEAPNLMTGWAISELALAMGVAVSDDRLRKRTSAMTAACAKAGIDAQTFRGYFKVLTITEAKIKQEQHRANIEGQIKARSRKSKPLKARKIDPNGRQRFELPWWELPLFQSLEGGAE